ncbi:MAG: hypothetical protein LAT84_12940 [Balneolia bacterium]|nr:hypothetical protein [Balneolia bacterium]
MKSLHSKLSLIGLFLFSTAFALQGCSDSSTGANDSAAVFNGSVDMPMAQTHVDGASADVSATVVSAARITSEGSLEPISGTEVETNASGEFTLEVDVNAAQHLAIVAENGDQSVSTVISSRAENGVSYTIQPVSSETSARAEVYARIVSNHDASIVSRADLEAAVSSELATAINASSDVRNQVAAGLSAAAEARAAYVAEVSGNGSSDIIAAAAAQRFEAFTELEATLHSGVTDQTREAALRAFMEASATAWVDAGLDESNVSAMAHMESRVMINSTSGASEEARNAARARAAWYAAIAMDMGAQAEASASGFSAETVDAIAQAGASLQAEVRASSGASGEIRAHFETFHEEVRAAMQSDGSVDASVILAIDSEINTSAGARAIFNAAINGTTSASILVEAYKVFEAAVRTTVEASVEGDAGQVQAIASLMMLINLGY